MSNNLPPDHRQTLSIVSNVADNVNRSHLGFRRRFTTGGQIERGETYMNGSRILIHECRPLMSTGDEVVALDTFARAADAREKLDGDLPESNTFRRFRDARGFRGRSKTAYRAAKKASDRALDHSILSPTNPPGTPLVPLPVPPAEHDTHDRHVAATSSLGERIQGTQMMTLPSGDAYTGGPRDERPPFRYDPSMAASELTIASYKTAPDGIPDTATTTLPSGGAGIGGPVNEAPDNYSSVSNLSLALRRTSIDSIESYKTERTVNSCKSRYNVLPRHKYADHSHLRPIGLAPLNIDDAPIPKTGQMDDHDEPVLSPLSAPPITMTPGPESGLESGAGPSTQPLDGPSAALPAAENVHRTLPTTPRQGVAFLAANPSPEIYGLLDRALDGKSFKR